MAVLIHRELVGRRAPAEQIYHMGIWRVSPVPLCVHPLIGLYVQDPAHVVDVGGVLLRGEGPPVDGQHGLERQKDTQPNQGRPGGHEAPAPPNPGVPDGVGGVLLPRLRLPVFALAVALVLAPEPVKRDAVALAPGEHPPGAIHGLAPGELLPQGIAHRQAEDPLARRIAPGTQEDGLQHQQDAVGRIAVQQADRPGVVRVPAEQKQADRHPQQTAQAQIQAAGEVPPPGVGHGGGRVRAQIEEAGLIRRAVQPVQVPGGVQGGEVHPVLPHGAAHLPRPVQVGPLTGQGGLLLRQQGRQGALPPLGLPDVLQGQAQLPQQLHLPQGVRVLLRVVPVVVGLPLWVDEALLLVKADAGPGHVQQGLQLADGHSDPLLGLKCKVSSGFTVKGFRRFFRLWGGNHSASSSRAAASWASVPSSVLYTSASRVRPVPIREVPLPVQ